VLIKKAFKINDLAARGPAVWARQAHDVLVLFSCWRVLRMILIRNAF